MAIFEKLILMGSHQNIFPFKSVSALALQAESFECINEMDPFPQLIDLIIAEQMYLN